MLSSWSEFSFTAERSLGRYGLTALSCIGYFSHISWMVIEIRQYLPSHIFFDLIGSDCYYLTCCLWTRNKGDGTGTAHINIAWHRVWTRAMLPDNKTRVYMTKITIREKRVQGTWLSGSKSRCSISSRERVLLIDGKKRRRSKIGAIFKRVGKVLLKTIEVVIALSPFVELALIILNWLGW